MTYSVKEIFYTLQGEGGQAGTPAVFCRFAGCNLWTGREQDRAQAICQFCDTDFVGTDGTLGGKFETATALAELIAAQWPAGASHRLVVLTGGEPLLQVDAALVDALHAQQFRIAVESNGTIAAPEGIDWLCISPKAGAPWVQRSGQELKLVWPQPGFDLQALEQDTQFTHRFLQPMDGLLQRQNIAACISACMARPAWRLSLQTHKLTGIR
ncbi:MAG: 7-carboxy-7-deazaguanine synthase [Acidovorax sp.]|uniref:7-carboxy-7-deazaguanine synthase n=1 Tax=Acidovorax sp. TaxID=1872122 RepID=UPI00260F0258|nr:7-carboxy-7-deazaguanine synthase [Acidovorax sp.]MDH4425213.1 7-carboxy-7-deazaguanine synthase [Acidovorax sp.]MDH4447898.1 7-carboxy-7-deazaguanine synthase [Acidovorax sp.]MDH4462524.1 7-carboxy-7-deazaguanine synthase [Acidovorax sp.]